MRKHPRLQTDQTQQLWGTVVQLAADLDARRLDAVAGRRAAVSMSRLRADAELVGRLDADGFEGPGWDRFVDVLVEYGCAVLTAWTVTGVVHGHVVRHARIRLEAPPVPITQEDAEDLASETVADALVRFRDRVLRAGQWDHCKGASLATYWVGFCILRFPDVYRRWLTAQRHWHLALRNVDGDRSYGLAATPAEPAHQLILNEDVAEALDSVSVDATRQILTLKSQGYRHVEISELLGCTVKSIESRLARHWRSARAV